MPSTTHKTRWKRRLEGWLSTHILGESVSGLSKKAHLAPRRFGRQLLQTRTADRGLDLPGDVSVLQVGTESDIRDGRAQAPVAHRQGVSRQDRQNCRLGNSNDFATGRATAAKADPAHLRYIERDKRRLVGISIGQAGTQTGGAHRSGHSPGSRGGQSPFVSYPIHAAFLFRRMVA
jgi:hypothetical protein